MGSGFPFIQGWNRHASGERVVDDLLRFFHDGIQMRLIAEALGIDFVDVFGAGRPGREPARLGNDL